MKKLIRLCAVLGTILVMACPSFADLTPINPSQREPDLLGTQGILDTLYGLNNITRIADGPFPGDQLWKNLNGGALLKAKYAGASETFGYFDGAIGGTYVPLLTVTNNGYYPAGPSVVIPGSASLPIFRLGLQATGYSLQSSLQSDNVSGNDKMVTWLITSGLSKGNYVVGWEATDVGDRDYQDLVVEISNASPVPAPGAILLGILGLCVAGLKLRKFA